MVRDRKHNDKHEHKHEHKHDHHSHHGHAPANYNRAFAVGIALNVGFVIIEAVCGVLANSVALLADAGHNSSDVLSLVLAWGASILSRRRPSQRYTYGLRRSSILVALFNAVLLLLVMGGIAWETIQRFHGPAPVAANTVIVVALAGIAVNGVTALMFFSGRKSDLNIRGAFLHMASDALVSLGVVLAGIAIAATGWLWLDPAVSSIIVAVVVIGTWKLLKDSVSLALDGVPEEIEPLAVRSYLSELSGVSQVHDLHIWGMSTTETALTAHLVIPTGYPGDAFLAGVAKHLHDYFGIEHATIQVEKGDPEYPCTLASSHHSCGPTPGDRI